MANFPTFYAAGNVPEDVINALFDISPLERPFTGRITHIGADSARKEWLDHALRQPNKDNAIADGAAAVADDTSQGVRYWQHMQLQEAGINLGDQASNSDGFGRITSFETQLEKRVNELYRDTEASSLSRNPSFEGAEGTANKAAGFFAQIKSNVSFGAGGSAGGWNSGTGIFDAPTQSTATRALAEQNILDVMTSINTNGGRPDAMTMIPALKVKFSSYMMTSSSRVGVLVTQAPGGQGGATAVQSVMTYETDFGVLQVLNNQIMLAVVVGGSGTGRADVAIFQTDMAQCVDQWTPRAKRLGPQGAGETWQVTNSFGSILLNEKAHGGVFDNDYNVDMTAT